MKMMKQEESVGAISMDNWGRVCHKCGGSATAFSSAYLCSACDRDERVMRICDACELAPAVFYCKADAASLCPSCDAHIHSVNHLARRHHRISILPPATAAEEGGDQNGGYDDDDDQEAASWLLPNPHEEDGKLNMNETALLNDDDDEDLDTVEYLSSIATADEGYGCGTTADEGVVPFQLQYHNFNVRSLFDDDFYDDSSSMISSPKPAASSTNYGYHGMNMMEVGVVPDQSIDSEIRAEKGTMEVLMNSSETEAIQLRGAEREARVLRYKEKKKKRKFEKTIRYASRKAYAETRPRIKGRFAKRSSSPSSRTMTSHHGHVDIDGKQEEVIVNMVNHRLFSTHQSSGGSYGQVVPSF
ncbi:Zinc finger protein CONSTANS-LIKE 2 [Linum perenne]